MGIRGVARDCFASYLQNIRQIVVIPGAMVMDTSKDELLPGP